MSFRNKILLSIWGVVLSLLVITFFIINYWTRGRIENVFANELRTNFSTIRMLTRLQSETLVRSCLVIAESPRLRAVAEVGDPGTAYQLSREMSRTALTDMFMLTDRHGNPLAEIIDGKSSDVRFHNREVVLSAVNHVASTDFFSLEDRAYRVVSAPILLDAELIGTLTIGFKIAMADINALKEATNSDLLLVRHGSSLLSTLDTSTTMALLPALASPGRTPTGLGDSAVQVFPLSARGETYLAAEIRLNRPSPEDSLPISYVMMKPLSREVRESMASILETFAVVSLVFLGMTTVIGIVISKGISRPITALVRGIAEVSRGNYDHKIQVSGNDEAGFLTTKFIEMSQSLKEKMTELDLLNRDLFARNAALDDTLDKLKSAQEELVKNERLAATGRLTAQLAHEINNPIHNIQSCLDSALNRLPGDLRGRDLIEAAFGEAQRLSRLTQQMLNIYRSSYVEIPLVPTSVRDLLREVLAVASEELKTAGIHLTAGIDKGLPMVPGSKDKLKQVFVNMISNARDAMPNGGSLDVSAVAECGRVNIAIRDTGVGIPQENLNRIFDAFFTTKDKISGVGLGLSVSYGIVSQHNGTIIVESTPGKGSTFTVSLPSVNGT